MNTSAIYNDESYLITTTTATIASETIQSIKKYNATSPFDSWYVGGLLFMVTVIFVLLYANFYRENTIQLLWTRILMKIHWIQPIPQPIPSSHPVSHTLLV